MKFIAITSILAAAALANALPRAPDSTATLPTITPATIRAVQDRDAPAAQTNSSADATPAVPSIFESPVAGSVVSLVLSTPIMPRWNNDVENEFDCTITLKNCPDFTGACQSTPFTWGYCYMSVRFTNGLPKAPLYNSGCFMKMQCPNHESQVNGTKSDPFDMKFGL